MAVSPPPVRIGVVGLGVMGQRHARCVAAHPRAQLTMAVDHDPTRAPADIGCPVVPNLSALIGAVDAAIVAVPTALHAQVAAPLLEAGIACLVEKPFVATEAEAQALVEAARKGETVVRVGHIERYNPAVMALMERRSRNIRTMMARRMNAASARVTDIDVVMDLMVHDLDVVLALKGDTVTKLTAEGDRDQAVARLTFDDGAQATIGASRKTKSQIRDLRVATEMTELTIDYLKRSMVEMRKNGEAVKATVIDFPQHDPLTAQLNAFLDARDGRQTGVTPGEALAVMKLAWRIQAALKL